METILHDLPALIIAIPTAVALIALGYLIGTLVEMTKGE